MPDPRGTAEYQRARRAWLARQPLVCHWCGRPVTDTVKAGHPAKATVDHLLEVDRAAPLALDTRLWVVACWTCNSARGATYGNNRPADRNGIGEPSRDW